jgi:hypothetical protein
MTTLGHIKSSRRDNRSYWNSQVRFAIGLIREEQRSPRGIAGHPERLRHWLKSELQHRRNFEFFDTATV